MPNSPCIIPWFGPRQSFEHSTRPIAQLYDVEELSLTIIAPFTSSSISFSVQQAPQPSFNPFSLRCSHFWSSIKSVLLCSLHQAAPSAVLSWLLFTFAVMALDKFSIFTTNWARERTLANKQFKTYNVALSRNRRAHLTLSASQFSDLCERKRDLIRINHPTTSSRRLVSMCTAREARTRPAPARPRFRQ